MSQEQFLRLCRPQLGIEELLAVGSVLASGQLVQGPEVLAFEELLAEHTGRRFAVAVSSGTAALELSLAALGIGAGDEVVVPDATFPATANAVETLGARAVLADVDHRSFNLTAATLAPRLGPKTRAVIVVDQFGVMAEAPPLRALCRERGIHLLEDAACSLGSRDASGVPGGGYGVAACISFHPRKLVTTGEGGAICTDDQGLAGELRALRSHGLRDGEIARPGHNLRLTEIGAALGRVQMGRLPRLLAARRQLAALYRDGLRPLAARLRLQDAGPGAEPNCQTLAICLEPGADRSTSRSTAGNAAAGSARVSGVVVGGVAIGGVAADEAGSTDDVEGRENGEEPTTLRDRVREGLRALGIEASIATHALHRFRHYRGRGLSARDFPVSDALCARGLALPLFPGMSPEDVSRVVSGLRACLELEA